MTVLEKMIGKKVYGEQAYFDALYASIAPNGSMLSLGKLLERSARLFPDHVALICNDEQVTYQELYNRSSHLTRFLQEKGIKPRDRVLLYFENSIEFYICYFAIVQAGAVVAPLNTFLHEAELRHIINDAQPAAVMAHAAYKDTFANIGAHTPFQLFTQECIPPKNVPAIVLDPYALAPDEMAALLYTSGTTGLPKGVMLSSKNIMTNVVQGIARLQLEETERLFGVLPLFHSFSQNACVWSALFSGCTVIVVPKIERRLIMAALQHKPTIILGVPAFYGLLCMLKTAPFPAVKYFVSGGDALPDKIRAFFALIYGRKLCNGYGLTEASPMVAAALEDETMPTSNVGRPMPGLSVLIIDQETEKPLPQGQIGHLIVKGDNIMLGYYKAPEITHATIKEGWLHTGDLAYLDEKGRIVITGRLKDLIKHKGINIYPQEIENCIIGHPLVIRAAVIGKDDEATGQVPIAFVQVRTMEKGLEKALKELCQNSLASYKVPREFMITIENLPMTATGKVDKKVLKKGL